MANQDLPHGLRYLRRRGGGPFQVATMVKLAAFGTAIFKQDVVIEKAGSSTEGKVVEPWASATPGTTFPSGVSFTYSPLSTRAVHFINIDPQAIFEGQDNNDTDGFTAANEGLNVNVEAGAGSATTKISGHELDESTIATTAALDCKILGLYPALDNAYGSWARIEVLFNQHRGNALAAGV